MTRVRPLDKYNVVRDPATLRMLFFDPEWVMQEKVDGERSMCGVDNGEAWARGNTHFDKVTAAQANLLSHLTEGSWSFDGETVGSKYFIFNMLTAPDLRIQDGTFMERHMALTALLEALEIETAIPVPMYASVVDKMMGYLELRGKGAEGVVFHLNQRQRSVPYKFKFYQTVDCVVIKKSTDGKRVCEVGVFKGAEGLVSLGRIKVEYDQIDRMTGIDPVVEVRYRKLSDGGRLIEPVFQRIRTDKPPYLCTWDQVVTDDSTTIVQPAIEGGLISEEIEMTDAQFADLFWANSYN